MIVEGQNGLSRQTVLALLLRPVPGPVPEPAPEPALADTLLGWTRRQPPGPLALADAPIDPVALRALLPVLAERRRRLDADLAAWTRQGVWVIGHDDPAYPKRLRRRLGGAAPELLFGRGEASLAGRGGVAVIQGGAADPDAILTLRAALADSLLSLLSLSPDEGIRIERLPPPGAIATLRLSPPGANGDDRRMLKRSCFALADTVVAIGVCADDPAWAGLMELIAQDRQPVWVLGSGGESGLLVRAGAHAVPPDLLTGGASALLLPRTRPAPMPAETRREPGPAPRPALVQGFAEPQARFDSGMQAARPPVLRLVRSGERENATSERSASAGPTLFELFAERLAVLLSHGPLGAVRIAEAMDLTRTQVDAWLLRAVAAGRTLTDPRTRLFRNPDR